MKVYRLPYGRVYHRIDHTIDPGDPPFAFCNIHYRWNDQWVAAELKDVPRKDVCRRCYPSPGKRITYIEILEARLKEALDGWQESEQNWVNEYYRDWKDTKALQRIKKMREEFDF